MPNYNKVILVGHLTRDPESKFTPSGANLAKGGIAVNDNYKDRKESYFFDFTVWGKLADVMMQYCHKGDPLLIEGKLKQDRWEKDGQKQSRISITVEKFQMLGSKGDKGHSGSPQMGSKSYAPQNKHSVEEIDVDSFGTDEFDANDMPF